jgi:hypothetical protein
MAMLIFILRFTMIFLSSSLVWADDKGVGVFANSMVEPVGMVASFITTASIMIGIGCLFGAFLRYTQFRVNPLASPISSVIILIAMGLVLLAIPTLNWFFSDSIAFLHS